MAGAAGSYADPYKARDVGLIPSNTRIVHQLGNTSLEMAVDLVSGKETLEGMHKIADRAEHISFSMSETFKQNYFAEYAYWCEGARYPKKNLQRCLGASCLRCEHACSGFKLGVNRVEILEV